MSDLLPNMRTRAEQHPQPDAPRPPATCPRFFELKGACMRPLIRDGEVLPISPLGDRPPSPGDIVLYESGGKRHLHRVWLRKPGRVYLKDDTGTVSLHTLPERKVLGVLEGRRPLSRGLPGLLYSFLCTAVFILGRKVLSTFRPADRTIRPHRKQTKTASSPEC